MVWIGSIRCEKFRNNFMARSFGLIALVWRVFVQQRNSHKCTQTEKTHQNMSLGSNCVDHECSLRKIMTQLRGTNFYINCTSLARFAASFVQQRNGSKCTQTERNTPKHVFRVQWCGSGVFIAKNSDLTSGHELLHHSLARFAASFVQQRNGPKCTEMKRNAAKHEIRVQWCGS